MRVSFFLAWIALLTAEVCTAQDIKSDSLVNGNKKKMDTTFIKGDGEVIDIESFSKRYDPRKALFYSAIFPGAGQVYNKKYWKVPLVYGGFGTLVYIASFYDGLYRDFRSEYFVLVNDPTLTLSPKLLTKDQLANAINKTRRERDFFIILTGIWYMLQMVDAHVDAHLKEFDLNPKMQVKIEPMIENSLLTGLNSGIALKIKF